MDATTMGEAVAGGPATITVALLVAALALKVTDFVKYLRVIKTPEGMNGILTLLLTFAVSLGVVAWLKETTWAAELKVGSETLKTMDGIEMALFALVFTGVAGTLYDFKKAVDSSDSAKKPKIVQGAELPSARGARER